MAEIRIQRKRRRTVWPWLLGLLVLALLPLPFLADRDEAPVARGNIASPDTVASRDTVASGDTMSRVTATAGGALAPASTTRPVDCADSPTSCAGLTRPRRA